MLTRSDGLTYSAIAITRTYTPDLKAA